MFINTHAASPLHSPGDSTRARSSEGALSTSHSYMLYEGQRVGKASDRHIFMRQQFNLTACHGRQKTSAVLALRTERCSQGLVSEGLVLEFSFVDVSRVENANE